MLQNETPGRNAANPTERTWRLNLNQPSLLQVTTLVILAFAIGAALGLIFS